MEKINIDFKGYITVDKNDLVINEIDNETGDMKRVDVSKLSTEEILEGYKKGHYFVDLCANHTIALDGEEDCELEKEED
jgi:hypothetical protein